MVPVGLFGVQTSTIRVRGVIAAAIASRSCRSPAPSGTCTGTAPASVTRIGYASNDRQANTTSSPGSQVAAMSWPSTPTDPGPSASRSAGTSSRSASAAVRLATAMSGYRFIEPAASRTTSSTDGSGGYGFSLLLIL